jgi:hypothetical protein
MRAQIDLADKEAIYQALDRPDGRRRVHR